MLADQPDQPLMSVTEVAETFDVGKSSVRRWIRSGRLRAIRLPSGRPKVRRQDVEAILRGEQPESVAS